MEFERPRVHALPALSSALILAIVICGGCGGDGQRTLDDLKGGPGSVINIVQQGAGAGGHGGLGGAGGAGVGTGGKGGGAVDAGVDRAPADGPRADGATSGDGSADAMASQAAACLACEQACVVEMGYLYDYANTCFTQTVPAFCASLGSPTTVASDGPQKGRAKTVLCSAVLDCLRSSQCAFDPSSSPDETCWCGTAPSNVCLNGGVTPHGPCRTVIENGLESTVAGTVATRFNSSCFASAAAIAIYQGCDTTQCAGPCLGASTTGSGGSSGSGGAGGGTGGVSGAGGASGGSGGGGTLGSGGAGGSVGAGGSGGSTTSGSGGSGGSAAGGAGGTASGGSGGGGSGGNEPPHCPGVDLDGNGVLDCMETLPANPSFTTTAAAWTPEFGVTLSWAPTDAAGSGQQSGSLKVNFGTMVTTNLTLAAGASQCVPVASGANYELVVQASIDPNQASTGSATISVASFASSDCSGAVGAVKQGPQLSAVGSWQSLETTVQVPAGMRSALVRLVAQKLGTQGPFVVSFDNVLFKRL